MSIEMQKTPGAAWQAVEATGGGGSGPTGPTGATGPTGSGGGGGGFAGWTDDGNDPALVFMNGGGIATGSESDDLNGFFTGAEIELIDANGDTVINVGNSDGVFSRPSDNAECFQAGGANGATVALDAGTLPIVNLPTVDPGIAGALWNDSGTPAISTG